MNAPPPPSTQTQQDQDFIIFKPKNISNQNVVSDVGVSSDSNIENIKQ